MKTGNLKDIVADQALIAYCGLYCGACKAYLKGSCPGCRENHKATWCKIRQCCIEGELGSCADCRTIELKDCKKYNNLISKTFGFVFNSDRAACIRLIREKGYEGFAAEMAGNKTHTIKRK